MNIIGRAGWGARAPRSVTSVPWSKRERVDVHYSAGPPTQTVRQIQNFHMDNRDWSDIGYNFAVDVGGRIYECRGWTVLGAHIAGHNTGGIGIVFIGRDQDVTTAAMRSIRWLCDEADRKAGRRLKRDGHRDLAATACPGDRLHRWVHTGMPVDEPVKPSPSPPAGRPAPKPAVAFPLPRDHYFGPAAGPDRSVSGHHGRRFGTKSDREWLQEWTRQLQRRGWSIGKGKRWLREHGADGRYGDEYRALIRAWQADQKLPVTGRLDRAGWDAAYRNPIT
ncbi:N-acetylmuramoyl-L-alanine amidase [Micromonospora craterilacus]|uniref:N-acetylmuramoyl-L-alanine amidase n=1 Tax=Micromonospora craterilacus TaxID=1655439 RepID=A0A2W2E9X5_9ACTN|nr:N-acetylmuramoyl-L-alanine amidase [Micromonospora craterilacus]PZG06287.1 N-acetylmuramoyl-L-alanine amidase [Micromonospora craterilacus]